MKSIYRQGKLHSHCNMTYRQLTLSSVLFVSKLSLRSGDYVLKDLSRRLLPTTRYHLIVLVRSWLDLLLSLMVESSCVKMFIDALTAPVMVNFPRLSIVRSPIPQSYWCGPVVKHPGRQILVDYVVYHGLVFCTTFHFWLPVVSVFHSTFWTMLGIFFLGSSYI